MTHSVRQIFHLREMCCPSGEKGIIYSKVGVDIFFSGQKWTENALWMVVSVFVPFPSLLSVFPFCLLIILCDRRDSTLILASPIAILAANPHPLLFFFLCICGLARGSPLLWEALVCLALWWIWRYSQHAARSFNLFPHLLHWYVNIHKMYMHMRNLDYSVL